MKELFSAIQARLAAITAADGHPLLRYVDEDWGQIDAFEQCPVRWPCALIDCGDITVIQQGHHVMLDDVTVTVRIADLRLSNSSAQAPQSQKNKAFELLDVIAAVIKALHGWTPDSALFGRLQRTAQRRMTRREGIRIYEITFHCAMYNTVAARRPHTVTDYDPVIAASEQQSPIIFN